jgi:uncharacterized protein
MKEKLAIITIFLIFFTVYTLLYNITMLSETNIEKKTYTEEFQYMEFPNINETSATVIKVPAIDRDGNGVMALLSVEAKPGVGRTLTDINQIFFWVDTQGSIRTAKDVAANVTGLDLSKYDIVYSIQADASVIEGPSAGAALGIATIAELENRTINERVTITGTLNENGIVGQVSGIIEKAKAAQKNGMNLILIPEGQKTYTTYSQEKKCEQYIFTTICRTEVKPIKVNIGQEVDIGIQEISNVKEALKYFLI